MICMSLHSAQIKQRTDWKPIICRSGQMRSFYDLAFWCCTVAYCICIWVPISQISGVGVSQKLMWMIKGILISGSYLIPQQSQEGTCKSEAWTGQLIQVWSNVIFSKVLNSSKACSVFEHWLDSSYNEVYLKSYTHTICTHFVKFAHNLVLERPSRAK